MLCWRRSVVTTVPNFSAAREGMKREGTSRRNKKILKDHRTYIMADFQLWENIQAFCRPREDVINDTYRNNLLQNAFYCDEFSSSVGGYICKWSRILVQTWCPEVATESLVAFGLTTGISPTVRFGWLCFDHSNQSQNWQDFCTFTDCHRQKFWWQS